MIILAIIYILTKGQRHPNSTSTQIQTLLQHTNETNTEEQQNRRTKRHTGKEKKTMFAMMISCLEGWVLWDLTQTQK